MIKMPNIGDGATIHSYTDRNPATVIFVSDREIQIQSDNYEVVSGSEHDGSAEYVYYRNLTGHVTCIRPIRSGHLKGQWRVNGRKDGNSVSFGNRSRYRDPSF